MNYEHYRRSDSERARTIDLLNSLPKGRRTVLEIGARDGHFSSRLTEHFEEVTALDLRKPEREIARVVSVAGDVTALNFPDRSFDCVFCAEVLKHVVDLDRASKELTRVAKHEIVVGVPFKQDIRLWRTTCRSCGKTNPPWGHMNTFDEEALLGLFPGLAVASKSFVGITREATNWLSTCLMDLAGNPWGTYDQEEACIHCGAVLVPPDKVQPTWKRALAAVATRINRLQASRTLSHALWIHVIFSKGDSR